MYLKDRVQDTCPVLQLLPTQTQWLQPWAKPDTSFAIPVIEMYERRSSLWSKRLQNPQSVWGFLWRPRSDKLSWRLVSSILPCVVHGPPELCFRECYLITWSIFSPEVIPPWDNQENPKNPAISVRRFAAKRQAAYVPSWVWKNTASLESLLPLKPCIILRTAA